MGSFLEPLDKKMMKFSGSLCIRLLLLFTVLSHILIFVQSGGMKDTETPPELLEFTSAEISAFRDTLKNVFSSLKNSNPVVLDVAGVSITIDPKTETITFKEENESSIVMKKGDLTRIDHFAELKKKRTT